MEWETNALARIKKVPIFVRGLAKKKVEEYVTCRGRIKVTENDVSEVKKFMFSKVGIDTKKLVSLMQKPLNSESVKEMSFPRKWESREKLYEVTGCNDEHLCPLSLMDSSSLLVKLQNKLEEMKTTDILIDKIDGPVLYHHTFRIAVSECPNACSQPQIKDFGVISQVVPEVVNDKCINCKLCIEECKEKAIIIKDESQPVVNYSKCVGCFACIKVCPVLALVTKKSGYSVFIGGKLGRHPQFAVKLLDLVDENTVVQSLEICLKLYIQESQKDERFGMFVNRVGIESFRKLIF
ncbi:MAG: 4Fe-4S dicluster-binding protein [Candidatus Firestonebacteria bacterium]